MRFFSMKEFLAAWDMPEGGVCIKFHEETNL